jgi:hypothetical protein
VWGRRGSASLTATTVLAVSAMTDRGAWRAPRDSARLPRELASGRTGDVAAELRRELEMDGGSRRGFGGRGLAGHGK